MRLRLRPCLRLLLCIGAALALSSDHQNVAPASPGPPALLQHTTQLSILDDVPEIHDDAIAEREKKTGWEELQQCDPTFPSPFANITEGSYFLNITEDEPEMLAKRHLSSTIIPEMLLKNNKLKLSHSQSPGGSHEEDEQQHKQGDQLDDDHSEATTSNPIKKHHLQQKSLEGKISFLESIPEHLEDTTPTAHISGTTVSRSRVGSALLGEGSLKAAAQISRYDDEDDYNSVDRGGAGADASAGVGFGVGDVGGAGGAGLSLAGRERPRSKTTQDGPDSPPPAPPLQFPKLPAGEDFHVNEMGLSDGVFMFKYLGSFLSWMQPYDFPVELLRDALWKRVSVPSLIAQSLPVEAGFLACLCLGVALAMAAPLYVLGHACCRLCSRAPPPAPPPPPGAAWDDDYAASADGSGCRRRALLFVLDVLLMFMV